MASEGLNIILGFFRNKGKVFLGVMAFIAFTILLVGYYFVVNLFSFETISTYGFKQYGANLKHINKNSFVVNTAEYIVYPEVPSAADRAPEALEKSKLKVWTLPGNHNLQLRGFRSFDKETWYAIHTFIGGEEVNGYIRTSGQPKSSILKINWSDYGYEIFLDNFKQLYPAITDDSELEVAVLKR